MAEPQTNGHTNGTERFIDSINPDDPEREKELMKSVEVREDLRGMEARKRVSQILNSQAFRDELEEIIESQPDDSLSEACRRLKSGPHPASLIALQQISQLILPRSSSAVGALAGSRTGSVIPIADVKGINSSVYSKGERLLRCKLASLYRLMDLHGWTNGIWNHITVRLSQDKEHFLINPLGLMYNEITAGSLMKIDMQGQILDRGNTALGVNKAGFILHSAIHASRPDVRCIIHTHVPSTAAVSAMKCGLLPLSQDALMIGNVSYHNFYGMLIDEDEKEAIGRNLGPTNKVMFLRNHGIVVCGASVEEAWDLTYNTVNACEMQVRMIPLGLDNLHFPSEEAQKQCRDVATDNHGNVNYGSGKKWKTGELEFEAWMRQLDSAGYRTGYVYKQPIIKSERTDRKTSDVEYPAATSALAYYDEMGELTSPIKEVQERNKRMQKTDWLNTPNVYKREEIEEIGTDNPKKVTKWVPDTDSPKRQGTPVKISNPNQFAPQGANPKELHQQQKQIKDGYYTDKISAGPQSKVLEGGMTEGQIMDANQSATGDHVMIVGAASKGIIKREHQHNAIVFKSYYATNPFDKMSDDELKAYEEAVKKGEKPPREEVLQALQHEAEIACAASPEEEEEPSSPVVESATSPPQQPLKRGTDQYSSMRAPSKSPDLVEELKSKGNFQRSKSERKPKKGDKVSTSPEAAQNGEESVENGPESPSKDGKDKKKKDKKSRMPSFSFGKKKDPKKSKTQTVV